jgi:hypothetical protein
VPEDPTTPTINLAVLRGTASNPPELRTLPSGRRLATLAVRTHGVGPKATSIPVAVWDPPAWLEALDAGADLIVAGCLRRRFYRTVSGGLGSRVEVEATLIGRGSETRILRRVRRVADDALELLP